MYVYSNDSEDILLSLNLIGLAIVYLGDVILLGIYTMASVITILSLMDIFYIMIGMEINNDIVMEKENKKVKLLSV